MSSILIHLGMAVLAGSAPNDGCAAPAAIHGEGVFAFDSSAATSEGPVHDLCARPEANSGGADIAHDL